MNGTVYLLHFAQPLGNPQNPRAQASHYVGWAYDLQARLGQHRAGTGAAITRAAMERGIAFEVVATWPGTWQLERRIKALKATPRLCPICGRHHRGGMIHVHVTWMQLELELDDPFDLPAPQYRRDWFEISHLRSWAAGRASAGAYRDGDTDIPF